MFVPLTSLYMAAGGVACTNDIASGTDMSTLKTGFYACNTHKGVFYR